MDSQTAKFLLKKTKEDYAQIAEEFNHTRKYLWKDFEKLDQYVKDDDVVLDLGCGNGRLFELFNNKKINYFGIDNCPELIEKAKEKYQSSNAIFLIEDVLDLSFEDQKFDAIFWIAVLNHIPSKELRIKVLENIKRILKKEGILIMINWNFYQKKYFLLIVKNFFSTIFSFFNFSKKKLDFGDLFIPWKLTLNHKGSGLEDKIISRYYHAFTTRELSKLFQQTGFKVIKKYYTKKGEKTNWWKGYNIIFVVKR
ncbi:methyltransferase domain-containing protein [Candidatus Kuenenbacteria bacterium]|nr:methyltransferase domain-containing protein [Candidatus Kuenenbacteria bacterium]